MEDAYGIGGSCHSARTVLLQMFLMNNVSRKCLGERRGGSFLRHYVTPQFFIDTQHFLKSLRQVFQTEAIEVVEKSAAQKIRRDNCAASPFRRSHIHESV